MFRPEQFFVGRTRGWGVTRALGGQRARFEVTTTGHLDEAYQSLHFDEVFAYDDGRVDEWRWAMTRGRDGRYVAAEQLAGAGIVGRHEGGDYVLSFRRPLRPDGGFPTPLFRTTFTMLNPRMAFKRARVSLFGIPVGELIAVHERAG